MRTRLPLFVALLLALGLPARAAAQAPQAEVEAAPDQNAPEQAGASAGEALPEAKPRSFSALAAPDKVKLGETFVLTIEVRDLKTERYELPKDFTLGKEYDLVDVAVSRESKGDETLTRFSITAALFDLGEKRIPDLVLEATGPSGQKRLTVPGPPVVGVGLLGEDEQAEMLDILPPVEVNVSDYTALYVLAGTLAAATLLLLLVRWLKNRPKKPARAPAPPPPLPAHLRALRALEQLQREELPQQGRSKEFHFRLSEILRCYLGERFGFDGLDMTTEELLAALRRLPTPGLDFARFEALCREGDLVKYAKAPATPSECKVVIESAFGFVHATTPQNPGKPGAGPSEGAAA
ncbi:MAG: hypothetical protein ACOX6T_25555 [Myxococcales bacterium]|jgi:hypothetical protein